MAESAKAMNVPVKTTPEETRQRIMTTAEALFRQLGYGKTTVADIAGELGMSPANVYRFFSSKNAIVEAICKRCLGELEDQAWAIARSGGRAGERIERLFLAVLAYHQENFIAEKRVHDIVLVAIDQSWQTIQFHKESVRAAVELIIRDGIESGEFETVDALGAARVFMRALVCFSHPVLIAQSLQDGHELEAEARETARFLLRAITVRT